MPMHKYDYLLAVGTIFAFLDAWNIGANDAANSWASSVSSRSLTYLQAMIGGAILEFAGAVGVGGRVASTIRTGIVTVDAFESSPALLMLGMVCAVTASSLYLTMATKFGMPVSTTHSILGGVLGMGVGALGPEGVKWVGYKDDGSVNIDDGVVQVFMAWIIAPLTSGGFAAIIFLLTKYAVLMRSNPVMKALIAIPLYFWLAGSLITMLLIYKGISFELGITDAQLPGIIVGAGAAFGAIIGIFLCPWLYRVAVKEDWQLRWYHLFQGPLLLRRGEVPPPPADFQGAVRNFYEGYLTREELEERRLRDTSAPNADVEAGNSTTEQGEKKINGSDDSTNNEPTTAADGLVATEHKSMVGPKPDVPVYHPKFLFWGIKWALLRGVDVDIIAMQKRSNALAPDMAEIHARGRHFDNRTEYLFTFLQILTACAASFVHGANDVANAIAPYASIYQVWRQGRIPGEDSDVPIWILAFGGAGIAIGLWTYGYNIMSNLGNRITLMSPSRGFSMELGAAISVIIATQLALPVSTTQCITGAICGVGLCNGDWRGINWRMVAFIYVGWIITVPVAALISGCLMGFITYAPNWL